MRVSGSRVRGVGFESSGSRVRESGESKSGVRRVSKFGRFGKWLPVRVLFKGADGVSGSQCGFRSREFRE